MVPYINVCAYIRIVGTWAYKREDTVHMVILLFIYLFIIPLKILARIIKDNIAKYMQYTWLYKVI